MMRSERLVQTYFSFAWKAYSNRSFPVQGFTAVHIASITTACWVLLLNGAVGYQILDDGTPVSLTLIIASSVVFFIGTGYIALDTAFGWTGEFAESWSDSHRNIALYVLYQLWPLICLVVFFILESILVLRILGEARPMGKFVLFPGCFLGIFLTSYSIPDHRGSLVCNRSNLQLRDQHPSLPGDRWKDQWRFVRDIVYAPVGRHGLDLLEQYHRR